MPSEFCKWAAAIGGAVILVLGIIMTIILIKTNDRPKE